MKRKASRIHKRLLAAFLGLALLICLIPQSALKAEAAEDENVPVSTEAVTEAEETTEVPAEETTAAGTEAVEESTAAAETIAAETPGETESEEEMLPTEETTTAEATVTEIPLEETSGTEDIGMTVCRIGEAEYNSIDEAIAAASEGAVIEVLKDSTITKQFFKSLTFTGVGRITLETGRWDYTGGKNLTFDGAGLVFDFTSTASGWLQMCLGGTLNVKNGATCIFRFDSKSTSGTTPNCAIYMNAGSAICVENGSTFQILGQNTAGVAGQGIQLDSAGTADIKVTGESTFLIDGTNRGYVASPNIYIEKSVFTVRNCTNNASNGGNFTAIDSVVNYTNNRGHGLSTTNATIKNSQLTLVGNGYCGFANTNQLLIDGKSILHINGNGWNNLTGQAALRQGGQGTVEAGAVLDITDNYCTGLYVNKATAEVTIEDGVDLNIVRNGILTKDGKRLTTYGGGIWNVGKLTIPLDAVIYNNHADNAGDDICNIKGAKLTFGAVGSDWFLDGTPDCEEAIDGWYDDVEGNRWKAHGDRPYHVVEVNAATITGELAVKAAHGLIPIEPDSPELPDWDKSKSKTATNLDENFESQITLSLPSSQEELVSDVVFVLDKSTSPSLEDQALQMLQNLKTQIDGTGAKVKVGVVIFNKAANVTGLKDLSTEYEAIEEAIRQKIESGTNTHAGLIAGMQLLDEDTSVDASRKYLIFISDGITYMYGEQPTVTAWEFMADSVRHFAGPDNWQTKYGSNDAPANGWSQWLGEIGAQVQADNGKYDYPYGGAFPDDCISVKENQDHPNSIDKALYMTYSAYQEAASKYNCFALTANPGLGQQYIWGPSFMNYLANGKEVSFDSIQKEIYYLLDAGSKVVDEIGSTEEYNFDFVNSKEKLTLTVGGETLAVEQIDGTTYGFGKDDTLESGYQFVLHYYKDGVTLDGTTYGECFVWDINVPVSNFAPVQLTYTVKLTNPKTEAGTYGRYDEDGSRNYTELYTNNSATLFPVDSDGEQGLPEIFAKPTVSYTVPGEDPNPNPNWETSKSKTATNLDENFESQVTLSLPSASYKGNLDIVFVLDGSTSTDEDGLAAQAAALLDELAVIKNLNVKAGLVVFGGSVPVLENVALTDISVESNLNDLKTRLTDPSYDKMEGRSGSNLQAGVEAAIDNLAADTTVDGNDKYIIILSDGGARMWYENGASYSQTYCYGDGGAARWNSNEDFNYRYIYHKPYVAPRTFAEVWNNAAGGAVIGAYGMTQEQANVSKLGDPGVASWQTALEDPDYYTTYEAATYNAAKSIIKAAGESHVVFVSYPYHTGDYARYAESFISWLEENEIVSRYDSADMDEASIFASVKDELIQLVDAGSKVIDEIGGTDDYNFDFVNDMASLTLTENGTALDKEKISETSYGFGKTVDGYRYTLTYYKDGYTAGENKYGECFVWDINVPVTVDRTVQLTYTVRLTNPKTEAGTYGQYDADGSQNGNELYTNNSATLFPVDSNGEAGSPELFAKPTVSYTVKAPEPVRETTSVSVVKVWDDKNNQDGKRPSSVVVTLYADGVSTGKTLTLNADNKFTGTFTDLDKYADGKKIAYTVQEAAVEGYTCTITGNADNGYIITNSHTPAGGQKPSDPSPAPQPGQNAATGDSASVVLPVAMLLAAALVICVLLMVRRKQVRR